MWNQGVAAEVVDFLRGKRHALSHGAGQFLDREFAFVSHEDMSFGGHGLLWNKNFRLTPGRMIGGLLDLEACIGRPVSILVTLRRQDQWLASAYSEAGHALDNPSQADFERRVSELLEVDSAQRWWFEYDRLTNKMRSAFGEDRVHVLLQEDLEGAPELWEEKFAELLPTDAVIPDLSSLKKRNTQHAEGHSWSIRKTDRKIELRPGLANTIMSSFEENNRRFSSGIGRSVDDEGYVA